ncbi:MAG TPA: metallophosphoesterase family protein [Chloroflexota bacterium]
MRIGIVSDIHGNLAALDAVIADLERIRPDLILHGGDLAALGPRPAEAVDRVRELEWPGVAGNWDLAYLPGGMDRVKTMPPAVGSLLEPLAAWAEARLGSERVAWLSGLPREHRESELALLHASPTDIWVAPQADADNRTLSDTYGALGAEQVVYAHIHHPFVRRLPGLTMANSGSVGLPYDGDPRASYLLIEDGSPAVRRVEYDIEREIADLSATGFPAAVQVERAQRTATFIQPG